MKHVAALLLSTTLWNASAQDCFHVSFPGTIPYMTDGWSDARIHPDGGVAYAEWTYGITVGLTGLDAQPAWDHRIVHLSPSVSLMPYNVEPLTDGGYVVNGSFAPAMQFETSCAVRMDAAGAHQWARIYMSDSGYQMLGSWIERIMERDDGDLMAAMNCGRHFGVARLDASGVPVWHNRYAITTMEGNNWVSSAAALMEPGNAMVLLGYWYQQERLCIVHVAGDGTGDWAFTYELGGVRPTDLARAADGSYYVAAYSNATTDGHLVHLNADGTFDWMKSYTTPYFSSIEQLQGGNLIISGGYEGGTLLELTTGGAPINAWSSTIYDVGVELIGVRGDSIYLHHREGSYDTDLSSGLTIATSTVDLSCAFATASLPAESDAGAPLSTSDTLIVIPDELKSWTMNIGVGTAADSVDVVAYNSSGPARPGFDVMLYQNAVNGGGKTTGPLTRTLTFDPLLTYTDAFPTPSNITGNTITWTGPDSLESFDSEFSYVILTVPADAGLIGTTLTHTFSVVQDSVETSLANNTTTISTVITGSYDPNDKQVLPRDFYHIENDSILDYTIQFQNTGNDTAFTVVVIDTLPLSVDTRTFEMGAASHPYTCSLTGNGILTFTFANIHLPDSNVNEPLSHGLVNFRIKPILPLTLGQEITNAADIYFDFNDPIHTPDATVVVTDETGVRPLVKPAQLVVYPVPVKNSLTAMLPEGFKPVQAFVVGVDGRRLPMSLPQNANGQVPFAAQHLPAGAYVLTVRAQDGKRMSARFTKE